MDFESPTPGFGLKVKPASAKVAPAVEGTADAKAAGDGDDDKAGGSALDQLRSKGKERQVSIRIAPGEGGDATTS